MLTFKRALAFAGVVLTLIFLFHTAQDPKTKPLSVNNVHSPRPTGTFRDVQNRLNPPDETAVPAPKSSSATKQRQSPETSLSQPRPQVPIQDLRALPLRRQLAYIFPYDVETKFPAYIWQTWKRTPEDPDFEQGFKEKSDSWSAMHPGFVHEILSDSVAMHFVSHLYSAVPEVIEAYNWLPVPVLKADFFRYLILLARGGIYTDIDTTAIKSAVDWVPSVVDRSTYGLVIGIEADPDRPDWDEWYSRRIQFCQWTIQAKMGHPVLRDIVASITEESLRRKRAGTRKVESIVEFTGPAIWTDIIFNYFNDPEYFDMSALTGNVTYEQFTGMEEARKLGDVVVLPITCFSPGIGHMGAGGVDDPMAFVHHNFNGTWKPENERYVEPAQQVV